MGVCGSSSKLEIIYGNTTTSMSFTTDLSNIHSFLRRQYPELVCNGFYLESSGRKEIRRDEELKSELRHHKKHVRLRLHLARPFSDKTWDHFARSVFKLRLKQQEVAGTGFLLSHRLALTTMENFTDQNSVKLYSALFSDANSTEIPFACEGVFLVLPEDEGIRFVIVELSPTHEQWEFLSTLNPIPLHVGKLIEEGSFATVLHYTRSYPVLDKAVAQVSLFDHKFFSVKKEIPEGSSGSPVFNNNCQLIGVFSSYKSDDMPGSALHAEYIANKLLDLLEKGNADSLAEAAITEIMSLSKIPLPIKKEECDYSECTCYLDLASQTLIIFSSVSYIAQYVGDLPPSGKGAAALATPFGVIFVCEHKTWLFLKGVFQNVDDTARPHISHSLVFFRGQALAISGKDTRAVEAFDFDQNVWHELPKLPKRRYDASAAVMNNYVYLFGGKNQKMSSSIFTFDGDAWERLKLKMPAKLTNVGALIVREDTVLLFGGESELQGRNGGVIDAWEVNLRSGSFEEARGIAKPLLFSSFQPAYANKRAAVIYSNSGDLLRYDYRKKRFFDVKPDFQNE